MSEGYNPYRKANGEFATKAEAGSKCESDLNDAIESGNTELQAEIEEVIMNDFADTEKGQELLKKNLGSQAMTGARKVEKVYTTRDSAVGATYKRNKRGQFHSVNDKPSAVFKSGDKFWHHRGLFHRDGDKPAMDNGKGDMQWFQHGVKHREGDKPAVVSSEGHQEYWKNGKLHRDGDKPAIIQPDGTKKYYKNGVEYTP